MSWAKFKLLLWKNFTVQKRHPIGGLFEIIFPIFLAFILAYIRGEMKTHTIPGKNFEEFQPIALDSCSTLQSWNRKNYTAIAYSPKNFALAQLIESFLPYDFEIFNFDNSKQLNDFLLDQTEPVTGIEFDDKLANKFYLPEVLHYSIRLSSSYFGSFLYPYPYVSLDRRLYDSSTRGSDSAYYYKCFVTFQNEIERAFILKQSKNNKLPKTSLRKFAYPEIIKDDFLEDFALHVFPLFVVFAFLYSTKTIIKNVAIERESQMKETMKIMGLTSTLHWLSWFVKCCLMILVPLAFMIVFLTTSLLSKSDKAVFDNSNPFIIVMLFTVYLISLILFCFLMSVLFKKSNNAANFGTILYFLSYLPYAFLNEKFRKFGIFTKFMYCFPLNSGLSQGVFQILRMEINGEGLHFSNFFSRPFDIDFSFGEVFIVMIFSLLVHLLLLIYIDQVFPGDYGVPREWYFPLKPCIRLCKSSKVDNEDDYSSLNSDVLNADDQMSRENFEEEPNNLKIGIQISRLSKQFGTKTAVKNLNLNLYESQITVLLGHNGAGKTTTMSMLTGMIPPTAGTAYIDGKDIRYNMNDARNSLGLCPQNNILFDELTVEEHFSFFCRLKGLESELEIANETNKYIAMLEMEDKRKTLTFKLSGGMKRKLSIGIALCGNSRVVICDEPTSGMDSAGRRALWDILIEEKKNRTVLLTTHFMDEADILGDRIAIMGDGELKTVGSSFFLKKRFGTGYKLICEKGNDCDTNAVMELLKSFVPDVKLDTDTSAEATFILSEDNLPRFHEIFKALEDDSANLKVMSFGCSLTTMEEVFLKIGSDAFEVKNHKKEFNADDEKDDDENATVIDLCNFTPSAKVTGLILVIYQFTAIIYKKCFYLRRNYTSIIWYSFLSVWLVYIILAESPFEFEDLDSLKISFDSYEDSITIIEVNKPKPKLLHEYKNVLRDNKSYVEISYGAMDNYVLNLFNESFMVMKEKYVIGTTLGHVKSTAWFNPLFEHAIPLTLNTLNRAILKELAGENYDIVVTNKPYKLRQENETSSEAQFRRATSSEQAVVFPIYFLFFALSCYWPAVFIAFYIKERECRAKLLQFISGASKIVYWVTSFLFDYIIYFFIICLILGKIALYEAPKFYTFENLSRYLVVLAAYGFGMLPFVYLFSYLFSKHSTGESLVPVLCVAITWIYGMAAAAHYKNPEIVDFIYYIGIALPPACFIDILKKMARGFEYFSNDPEISIYSMEDVAIGLNLVYFFVSGLCYLTLCILIDLHVFQNLFNQIFTKEKKFPSRGQIDSDVQAEIDKVNSMTEREIASSNLVLKNLSKMYGNFLAVNQLCLAIEEAECFGLLGINGAGKTTTFKILTGDESFTFGDAFIRGFSMKSQISKTNKLIGYCPQFDALLVDLTGRQTLVIFCLLRGIPIKEMEMVYTNLSTELGLLKHLDKQVKDYSGGNKRKLSTALAMIGDPQLMFLDEPTSGIDPGARRQLWNVVAKTKASGRSIILTSHSMEECEALCSRLAIMVAGQFKCLGSTQHLKNKYSKGFILTVKVGHDENESDDSKDRINSIKNEIKQLFPSAELKEQYLDILTYHIPVMDLKWSEVFGLMAQMKNVMDIDDYSLTQTSLEQVFLFFSKSGIYQPQIQTNGANGNHSS